MAKRTVLSSAISFIFCFLTAMSLTMDMAVSDGLYYEAGLISPISNIFDSLRLSLEGGLILSGVVLAGMLMLRRYNAAHAKGGYKLLSVFCAIIALIWLFGQNFRINNSLDQLFFSPGQRVKSLIYFLGSYYFLKQLGILLELLLSSDKDITLPDNALLRFYRRRPFLSVFLGLFICALPTLIVCYPGYLCVDSAYQLVDSFGFEGPLTAHHPPFHTLLLYGFVKLGGGNPGLYLFILCQSIAAMLVFSYMLLTMRRFSAPKWLLIISFLLLVCNFNFLPVFSYAVKDNVYSLCILLFCIETVYMLKMGNEYWKAPLHLILIALSIIGAMLFRHNGKYVFYLCIPVIALFTFFSKNYGDRRAALKSFLFMALCLACSLLIYKGIIAARGILPGSRAEALSLPFQQTARFVSEHGESVSEDERTAIDAVLDYERLPELYAPTISDPVKASFKESAGTAELISYFRVWLKQGIKEPFTYIKATLNQNYYLFFPLEHCTRNWAHGHTRVNHFWNEYGFMTAMGISEVNVADGFEDFMRGMDMLQMDLPIIGLFSNCAFYTLLLCLLLILSIKRGLWRFIIWALPSVITVLTVIVAPVVDTRYLYPLLYSLPLLLCCYISEAKNKS